MMSENSTSANFTDSGVNEKAASRLNGMAVLVINTALMLAAARVLVWGFRSFGGDIPPPVTVLFGNYYGTLSGPGFFFVNPLVRSGGAISLKMQTLDSMETI